jgi:hypothetical protein
MGNKVGKGDAVAALGGRVADPCIAIGGRILSDLFAAGCGGCA